MELGPLGAGTQTVPPSPPGVVMHVQEINDEKLFLKVGAGGVLQNKRLKRQKNRTKPSAIVDYTTENVF